MKTCRGCGCEIDTRDGDNYCARCEDTMEKRGKARARARANRRARADVMRSLGLTKVRGALGGEYWE